MEIMDPWGPNPATQGERPAADREVLGKVMKIFTDRDLHAKTAQLLLAINDVVELCTRIDAAAFSRGCEYAKLQRDEDPGPEAADDDTVVLMGLFDQAWPRGEEPGATPIVCACGATNCVFIGTDPHGVRHNI